MRVMGGVAARDRNTPVSSVRWRGGLDLPSGLRFAADADAERYLAGWATYEGLVDDWDDRRVSGRLDPDS